MPQNARDDPLEPGQAAYKYNAVRGVVRDGRREFVGNGKLKPTER